MKRQFSWILTLAAASASTLAFGQTPPAPPRTAPPAAQPTAPAAPAGAPVSGLGTVEQKASYAIGLDIGANTKAFQFPVDMNALIRGVTDGFTGANPALTQQQIQEAMQTLQKDLAAKQAENMKVAAEKNKTEGEAFLAGNKTKEGVKTTASGLQYKVLKSGTGATPKATDTVVAKYRGTFLDGTEFDNSAKQPGGTVDFPVTGVIQGWTEALQLMKVGDKWQLFIPSNLAYKERGMPPVIGPNSTLVFDIELVDIKK
jgi:FKBP-type peptidyl-prolyl cis-trans isomerase FklB